MKIAAVALLSIITLAVRAQDATQPPANVVTKFVTQGVGQQVYACMPDGKWALQEPQADLIDTQSKQVVGKHTKGPTWTWMDGSAVTGKVLQQKPSDKTIPWLLLTAQPNDTAGALSDIAFVRRSDTQGGLPQPENICGAQNIGGTIAVPYQAIYTFYTAK